MKSGWDPETLDCTQCGACMDTIVDNCGDYLLWCPLCGTLFQAHILDVPSHVNWKQPAPLWQNTDPRFSVGKYADIVILRPDREPCQAQVDTKNGWSICTSYDDHGHLGADAVWNQDWQWTWAPKKKR